MHDITTLLDALHFAADKHRDQRRKDVGATPYINHCIALAELLARVGQVHDPVVLAGAILHDTVEDTTTSFEELERRYGPEITGVVREVTDDKTLDKAVRKALQVEHAAHASPRAKLVKLADKICNVEDVITAPPSDWSAERRREYLQWSARVVDNCRGTNAALEARFDVLLAEGLAQLAP
jgi:GTP diphosphokinase / guanosine-3',5'-bis(diphosphate) 3'-diphosphatase